MELPFAPSQIFPLDTDGLSSFRGVSATDGAKRGSCENGDARDVSPSELHSCSCLPTVFGRITNFCRPEYKVPFSPTATTYTPTPLAFRTGLLAQPRPFGWYSDYNQKGSARRWRPSVWSSIWQKRFSSAETIPKLVLLSERRIPLTPYLFLLAGCSGSWAFDVLLLILLNEDWALLQ